jgi:hypothetical protein
MAIIFSNNKTLGEVGGKLSVTGRIVQTVHTTSTATLQTTSTSAVDIFTSSTITLTNASNIILIEFHSDNRLQDYGDGAWNLYYMDLVHVQSSTQLTYSGYRGQYTYNIAYYDKSVTHAPGSVGPHSYKIRGWSYTSASTASFNLGSQRAHDGLAYIRLSEIAV